MSLITLWQCKKCNSMLTFKFNLDAKDDDDNYCVNCKSDDIEMIVEAVVLDSKAIEKKYAENIS